MIAVISLVCAFFGHIELFFYHMFRKASPKKLCLKEFYSQVGGYGSQFHEHLKTEPGLHLPLLVSVGPDSSV